VIELLVLDETAQQPGEERGTCMARVLARHKAARDEIEAKLSKHADIKQKTRDQLLAAIFLLSWFEVIRDQDANCSLFPRDLADLIITSDSTWNRYSQELLSWLNTLDSKATHLGGQHLLTSQSLQVVSRHPTQIISSEPVPELAGDSDSPFSSSSPGSSSRSGLDRDCASVSIEGSYVQLRTGQVKQILLNTVLQPALEWYLTTQSYCRRISVHDKHHRQRFTPDDEYEVITACKQLEGELFELWNHRPTVISLTAEQLTAVMSADLAVRLEEVFSVYLASFWILFVYSHRVSWWSLPHSANARDALDEVWRNMQRCYGEVINGGQRKIVHPALLWPLFLFGSECPVEPRRNWAIEQLDALGEAKPVLENEDSSNDALPTFRLSSGATRNAKRAAILLRELIKKQDKSKARVDDRDLSMEMFGCYFSIV
jgi:hypothetical protein